MRRRRQHKSNGMIVLAAAMVLTAPAVAQTSSDYDWYLRSEVSKPSTEQLIQGCTAIIQSKRETNKTRSSAFFNCGRSHANNGDYDRAIADYNEAIRLDPENASAYNSRGNANQAKGDHDHAIADYTEAIRLDPKYAPAYNNRGLTWYLKGGYDPAITDFNEAIRLNPKYVSAYFGRGRVYLYGGNFAKASADLSRASELDPKNAYGALWVDIVGQRNNIPSRLSQAITKIDMTAWPAPVIRLFLGEITSAALLAAADDPDATKKKGQVCEANFYSGELTLRQGAKEEAARLFRLAASECPKDFNEWGAANAELKALGAEKQ
jgi:lipoprotein NlpI